VLRRLADTSNDASLVVVLAPAGYGKTTAVRLWDANDPREFVWVQLDHLDDDPVHLLRHLALALSGCDAIEPEPMRVLWGAARSVDLDLLPTFGRALRLDDPIVLVLDDVHAVRTDAAQRCIDGFATYLPPGSQVVLVGRTLPAGALARRRMRDDVVEVDTTDLAMSDDEAAAFFAAAELELDDDAVTMLVERTEGWPGGLHLAALAMARHPAGTGLGLLSGRDRLVTDYLIDEALADYPDELLSFLLRSSVVERMSPALLDELLEISSSGQHLLDIEHSGNLFLVPLDHERQWYRYHQLFREALRGRLEVVDPTEARLLEARASKLQERAGDIDAALRHALAAGDDARAAALAAGHAYALVNQGLVDRLRSWVELLGLDTIDESADAAIAWAWYASAIGDHELLRRATSSAERIGARRPQATKATKATDPIVVAALVRSMMGLDGIDGVVRDTATVRSAGGPEINPWWAAATGIQATALSMQGDLPRAEERLTAALAALVDEPMIEAGLLAHLALLRLQHGDLAEATPLSTRALRLAETHRLDGVLVAIPVFAVGALVSARGGDLASARAASLTTSRLLARLRDLSPRTALLCNVLLAETALTFGDPAAAADHAAQAERARRREAGAANLNAWLDDLSARLAGLPAGPASAIPRLTPAELRLLDFLPTHLSVQEIAEQLGVSRNTAKSQNLAVYRKLGVASRSDAVAEARRLGILRD
jgi:LuxR family maltose regulon positive regulatory protein